MNLVNAVVAWINVARGSEAVPLIIVSGQLNRTDPWPRPRIELISTETAIGIATAALDVGDLQIILLQSR